MNKQKILARLEEVLDYLDSVETYVNDAKQEVESLYEMIEEEEDEEEEEQA